MYHHHLTIDGISFVVNKVVGMYIAHIVGYRSKAGKRIIGIETEQAVQLLFDIDRREANRPKVVVERA